MSLPVMSLTVNPSRLTWATEKPTREPVLHDRTRHAAADGPGAVVGERQRQRAGPAGHRRPAAGHVDQAAQRVAAEQRALRPAHELDLVDVEQLDARRVGVQLRDAVDVGGDARVVRARADAAEAGVAQLARRPLGEHGVRRQDGGLAHQADAGGVDGLAGDGGDADRHLLAILGLLLRGHRDRWHLEAEGVILGGRRHRAGGYGRLAEGRGGDGDGRHDGGQAGRRRRTAL